MSLLICKSDHVSLTGTGPRGGPSAPAPHASGFLSWTTLFSSHWPSGSFWNTPSLFHHPYCALRTSHTETLTACRSLRKQPLVRQHLPDHAIYITAQPPAPIPPSLSTCFPNGTLLHRIYHCLTHMYLLIVCLPHEGAHSVGTGCGPTESPALTGTGDAYTQSRLDRQVCPLSNLQLRLKPQTGH